MGFSRRILSAAAIVSSIVACDEATTPTNPDPYNRTGYIALRIDCPLSGSAPLQCRATAYCSGLYAFCPGFTGGDVTAIAPWSSADANVAQVTKPGQIVPIAAGDTTISVDSFQMAGTYYQRGATQTVSVWPDSRIFATGQIDGLVYAGTPTPFPPLGSGIAGVRVEITSGLAEGRTAMTGVAEAPPPGFSPLGCSGPGIYCFFALPAGNYRLRVSAPGFVPQERDAQVSPGGARRLDFALTRQN